MVKITSFYHLWAFSFPTNQTRFFKAVIFQIDNDCRVGCTVDVLVDITNNHSTYISFSSCVYNFICPNMFVYVYTMIIEIEYMQTTCRREYK